MININTNRPCPDISGHHPGFRAKFLVSQAIWSPPEQKVTNKCCVYDQYRHLQTPSGHFRTSPWPQGQVPGEPGHLEPPRTLPEQKVTNKCCVYDQYQHLRTPSGHFWTSPWLQGKVPDESGHLEPPRALPQQKVTIKGPKFLFSNFLSNDAGLRSLEVKPWPRTASLQCQNCLTYICIFPRCDITKMIES